MLKNWVEISVSVTVGLGFLFLGSCAANSNSQNPNAPQTGPAPSSQLPQDESLLIQSVIDIGRISATGKRSELLCGLARKHLQYMSEVEAISHDGFSSRSQTIQNNGGTKTGEIVASNRPRQPPSGGAKLRPPVAG